jgi:hypothetical protein
MLLNFDFFIVVFVLFDFFFYRSDIVTVVPPIDVHSPVTSHNLFVTLCLPSFSLSHARRHEAA